METSGGEPQSRPFCHGPASGRWPDICPCLPAVLAPARRSCGQGHSPAAIVDRNAVMWGVGPCSGPGWCPMGKQIPWGWAAPPVLHPWPGPFPPPRPAAGPPCCPAAPPVLWGLFSRYLPLSCPLLPPLQASWCPKRPRGSSAHCPGLARVLNCQSLASQGWGCLTPCGARGHDQSAGAVRGPRYLLQALLPLCWKQTCFSSLDSGQPCSSFLEPSVCCVLCHAPSHVLAWQKSLSFWRLLLG